MYDTIIVGGGLAGACAALYLSREQHVLLLEAEYPAAGASGMGTGMANPLTPRRGRMIWGAPEALFALEEVLELASAKDLFRSLKILQPAQDADQAATFQDSAQRYPEYARWMSAEEVAETYEGIGYRLGALEARGGGTIEMPALVGRCLVAARKQGAELKMGIRVERWNVDREFIYVTGRAGSELVSFQARRLLLAVGASYRAYPALARLRLHAVKGQVVHVANVALPCGENGPILASNGYILPTGRTLIIGSSYVHDFDDLSPSKEETSRMLKKAQVVYPAIRRGQVIGEGVGVRVNVPGIRLPMVGPLPGECRVWVFTALGSRGLLMAPFLAGKLLEYFRDPEVIPGEIRVRESER